RIFKSVGLRWIPTGKLFDSCTSKVESEPPHGSNVDISKIHECKKTLDLSAGTSIKVPKEQSLDVSAGILWNVNKENLRTMALNHDSLSPANQRQANVPQVDRTISTSNELDLLFSLMFDELLNGSSKVVSKSSAVYAADAPNQRQQYTTPLNNHTTPAPTCQVPTLEPTVTSSENINQAEMYAENDQVADDEFINIFSTPVQDQGETSSRHVDSLNMHTFYQRKHRGDILLVQIYVDDIIFGSTNPNLSKHFEKLTHSKIEMSMMGELKFFLGIQIYQSPRGIFINQAKYAQEILVKHGMTSCDGIGTPMATKHLDADLNGTPVDQTKYRSKVGALMYLTANRPDIMHATCYCARYQAQPTEKHLTAVKRIFRYLKDTIHMGLWYPKDTGFKLTAFSDSDHAGCLDSRKSTSGGIQFLGGDSQLVVKEAELYFNVFRRSRVCVSICVMRSSSMDENSTHRLWVL
nr:uncharacterized mitochondrial protein AtMg00810-like [Tanacetum cinerariifolium]